MTLIEPTQSQAVEPMPDLIGTLAAATDAVDRFIRDERTRVPPASSRPRARPPSTITRVASTP